MYTKEPEKPEAQVENFWKKLQDFNGFEDVLLLLSDGDTRSHVLMRRNSVGSVHSALHYLLDFASLDVLKILRKINKLEVNRDVKTIDSTHSLYENVMSLVKDAQELDVVEKEVYAKVSECREQFFEAAPLQCYDFYANDVSVESALSNPQSMLGLSQNLTVVPDPIEPQMVSTLKAVAVGSNGQILGGISLADRNPDGSIGWKTALDPEEMIGCLLKYLVGSEVEIGSFLRGSCGLLFHHMSKLKASIEAEFRRTKRRGQAFATCRGCSVQMPCCTIDQKRQLQLHTATCSSRQQKKLKGQLVKTKAQVKYSEDISKIDDDDDKAHALTEYLSLTAITVSPAAHSEYLFAMAGNRFKLLLVKGERNVNMIHGAAHFLSTNLSVDHRRIFQKLALFSKTHYYRCIFRDRSVILHSKKFDQPLVSKNVYLKIRQMQQEGKPLVFPKPDPDFCIAKDLSNGCTKVSETFQYLPYIVNSSLEFLERDKTVLSAVLDESDVLAEVDRLVIASWDDSASVMRVSSSHIPETKVKMAKGRKWKPGTIDTLDTEVDMEVIKREVDFIVQVLKQFVEESLLKQAVIEHCPYIQFNLNLLWSDMSTKAVKTLDERPKVCACGITFPNFTSNEQMIYRKHNLEYHEQNKHLQFVCPIPGCNKWTVAESALLRHIDGAHGEQRVCNKCGNSFRQEVIQNHEVKCGKMFKCKLCDQEFPVISMGQHFKDYHVVKERVQCEICGKDVQKRLLSNHMKIVHLPDHERQFVCQNCGKGFICKSKLKRHTDSKHACKPR